MQTGVLNVIGGDRLLSLDLYINVHADSSRHGWFVCTLVCEEHKTYGSTVTQLKTSGSEKLGHTNGNVRWKRNKLLMSAWPRETVQLTQIVPDVHLSAQSADLDDGLAEEVVRLPFELLLYARLNVVVLVPHAHLDAVGGVVTFTETNRESAKYRIHADRWPRRADGLLSWLTTGSEKTNKLNREQIEMFELDYRIQMCDNSSCLHRPIFQICFGFSPN